jgi:hypothetical protein
VDFVGSSEHFRGAQGLARRHWCPAGDWPFTTPPLAKQCYFFHKRE